MSIINVVHDPTDPREHVEPWSRWLALAAFVLLITILNMDATVVNLTIGPIEEEMKSSLKILQWVISIYGIAWSVFVIPSGKFANKFGKKKMLITGISIFILSSILCAIAHDVWLLILGRFIQGVGAAICIPPIYGLVYDKFPAGKRGFPIGLLGTGTGVGLAIGPTIGGFIMEQFPWPWIYYLNIPLGILVLLIVLFTIRKESQQVSKSLDLISSLYVALIVLPLSYGINNISTWGLLSYQTLIVVVLVAAGLVMLHLHSKKATDPLIPKGTFSNKLYVSTLIGFMFLSFILGTVLVLTGLYMGNVLGFTTFHNALIFIGFATAFSLVSPIGGKLSEKMDARIPACIGLGISIIGIVLALFYGLHTTTIYLVISLALMGFIGLSIAPYNATMLKAVNRLTVDALSGLYNMCGCMGFSIGVVISTNVLVQVSNAHLKKMLHKATIVIPEKAQAEFDSLITSAHRNVEEIAAVTLLSKEKILYFINESFLSGFHASMYTIIGAGAVAIILTLLWMKVPAVSSGESNK
ncbi:MAG: MFS transporter [Bacteroidales bacterium]|nr:MFS transporter [Bacteroidota bacterium]MBL6950450.1 MFS transporter [Bacteroidales bacterium]